MSAQIRVLLVDDQTLVRQGIRSLLSLSQEIEVVGEGGDGDEALRLLAELDTDVLLLDLRMPGRDGIATLEAMRDQGINVPALVLTTFDDDRLVLQALQAGARGYLLKDVSLNQLVSAVTAVAAGGMLVHPGLTDRLARAMLQRPESNEGTEHPEPLTPRELDVLRLAAAGWSNREIARGLHLSEGTVKNYMSSILLKLGVRDRTRAVLRAFELHLIIG